VLQLSPVTLFAPPLLLTSQDSATNAFDVHCLELQPQCAEAFAPLCSSLAAWLRTHLAAAAPAERPIYVLGTKLDAYHDDDELSSQSIANAGSCTYAFAKRA
jgi:hypothetical protein